MPDLKQCPELYIELQTYALSVLVERKVEAQHAAIKRLGVVAGTACSVAGICSKLRGPENLRLLDTCPRFKAFCVDMWATKNLVRQTLRHVGIDPTGLSAAAALMRVFRCSVPDQFQDMTAVVAMHTQWKHSTAHMRALPASLVSGDERLCVAYLRCKMETGALLSLPSVLFNHATLDTDEAQWPRSDTPVADALQHMEVGLVDFAWHTVAA